MMIGSDDHSRKCSKYNWADEADLRLCHLSDFAVFEDFVEHVGEGGGSAAGGVLRVLEGAGEVGDLVVALASGAELVGDVEGGEDGDAEGVDGVAEGGDGAHLGVDDGGEALDVGGIGAAEIVDLVVDVYGDRLSADGPGSARAEALEGRAGLRESGPSCLLYVGLEEFVHLLEHLFDAEADLVALFVEGAELGFDGLLRCFGRWRVVRGGRRLRPRLRRGLRVRA